MQKALDKKRSRNAYIRIIKIKCNKRKKRKQGIFKKQERIFAMDRSLGLYMVADKV